MPGTTPATKTYAVITPAQRIYPDPANSQNYPGAFLRTTSSQTGYAGFWDDVYTTEDSGHSSMRGSWSGLNSSASISYGNQPINVDSGTGYMDLRRAVGTNFTTRSLAYSGHQQSCGWGGLDTEQNFLFSNTVRGSPAFESYVDTGTKRVDFYDNISPLQFWSIGQSGSEEGGIGKLMIAGAHLPRATKDLLKLHGAYANALLYIFKAALPYASTAGAPLGFNNEVRHRVAYMSSGDYPDAKWGGNNFGYHGFNDSLHLYNMVQMASTMTVAPPTAILKVLNYSLERNGQVIVNNAPSDPSGTTLREVRKTYMRVWGAAGERITINVSMADSFDLQNRPLTYQAALLYPEQRNVTISQQPGSSTFTIVAQHNPSLPKGKIPVIITADNGVYKSNPAFVNFYWPETGQTSCPWNYPNDSINQVTRNQQPVTTSSSGFNISLRAGTSASTTLTCTDPEGFATRLYRWEGEAGTFNGTSLSYSAPANASARVIPANVICSDGTGRFSGVTVNFAIDNGVNLPAGWVGTDLGTPESQGQATYTAPEFAITASGYDMSSRLDQGHFAFYSAQGDVDIAARVTSLANVGSTAVTGSKAGVMIRDSLDIGARRIFVYAKGNGNSATSLAAEASARPNLRDWWNQMTNSNIGLLTSPTHVRAILRGTLAAGFASSNGFDWEQLLTETIDMGSSRTVGLAVTGNDTSTGNAIQTATARLRPITLTGSLPIATLAGARHGSNNSTNNVVFLINAQNPRVTVTLTKPATAQAVYYTTDGSTPTEASQLYTAPFELTAARAYRLKSRAMQGGALGDVATVPFTLAN